MTDTPQTIDFGASAAFGTHLFRVEIPEARNRSVVIAEDYGYRGHESGIPRDEERVALKRPTWSAIADIARRELNDRPQGRQNTHRSLAHRHEPRRPPSRQGTLCSCVGCGNGQRRSTPGHLQ